MIKELHLNAQISHKAIIFQNGKVLLVKDRQGRFEFPGGRMHEGEEPVESLKREIQEELSIAIEPERIFDTFVDASMLNAPRYTVVHIAHTLEIINIEKHQKEEILEVRWVEEGEVKELPMLDQNRKVLLHFFNFIDRL
jgi:8-oxo-dGTP diphosphatase